MFPAHDLFNGASLTLAERRDVLNAFPAESVRNVEARVRVDMERALEELRL